MALKIKMMVTTLAIMVALTTAAANAATMSANTTAPVINGADIANYGTVTGTDKWWNDAKASGYPKGQTFTTGETQVLLNALTYQVTSTQKAEPTKTYVIRVSTVSGTTLTPIYSETATQTFTWNASEYMTWTFDSPLSLSPNTVYGIDVGMTNSTSGWTTGIPYINRTADEYAGGTRYMSGTSGLGIGDTTMNNTSGDMIFHLDMDDPMQPTPKNGATVPSGDVTLSWQNYTPTHPNDPVYVDVWFGTDSSSLTQVPGVSGVANAQSVTANAPVAGTYYWRVDSYLNGTATGTPREGNIFIFYVDDTDGDGLPDSYELRYTDPPSGTALDPNDDLENEGAGDGLTTMEEYQLGSDPTNPDTDGDTLEDGAEVDGAGDRPATSPLLADTDKDGIDDGIETNTGIYVNATDTGTDPTKADSDGDGLTDGVETNTKIFVNETNTGTNPIITDSDGDKASDWYEVAATYTDPTDPADNPGIAYPLPASDPDDIPAAYATKPVKVYIMSGQSNMVGFGTVSGDKPGTLETITKKENKFPNLVDETGAWVARNDVMYRGVISCIGNGPLKPGFGASSAVFGPELGFGQVMGYFHDEPVLLIKSSIGNRSISWDFAPPSTERFIDGDYTYAAYGESPNRWLTGAGPTPYVWYAGKQWDDCFLTESDMGAPAWTDATSYPQNCQVTNNGVAYISKVAHTSSAASEPGVGAQSSANWNVYSVFNVADILDNFAAEYPEFASQGFEIAGYVWWQGHKDQGDPMPGRYEQNMTNFINSIRDYYENRYPDNTVTEAPFVLATVGFDGGWENTSPGYLAIAEAQLAVSDPAKHPEFDGNVKTIEARGYWRDGSISPTTTGYHYNHNAETQMLVGDALGRAMADLESAYTVDAGPDMVTWSGEPVQLDGTIIDKNGSGFTGREWIFDPNDPLVIDSNSIQDPVVTITKPAGEPISVTLQLLVDDGTTLPVKDTVTITVYDDACQAARIGKGLSADNPMDLDANCITDIQDLALLAAGWLTDSDLHDFSDMTATWHQDYTLTAPVAK